jgi:hypothetical protein
MTRTQRKRKYDHVVRTKNYHKSKRTAQRADPTTNKPTRGSDGYRAPLKETRLNYCGNAVCFDKRYPTYKETGSQPPLDLIQRKRRERRARRINSF